MITLLAIPANVPSCRFRARLMGRARAGIRGAFREVLAEDIALLPLSIAAADVGRGASPVKTRQALVLARGPERKLGAGVARSARLGIGHGGQVSAGDGFAASAVPLSAFSVHGAYMRSRATESVVTNVSTFLSVGPVARV